MTINWPRIISFLAISIALPAAVPVVHFSDSLLGAIYTVTSIVFSIGMSMVYGVDLGRLKNRDYYVSTKRMLLRVRDTSMFLFFMDSVFFYFRYVLRCADFRSHSFRRLQLFLHAVLRLSKRYLTVLFRS